MKIYLISLGASLVAIVICTFILYNIFAYYSPSVSLDGHRYMPLENIFKSVVFSSILSIITFFISIRIQKKKN